MYHGGNDGEATLAEPALVAGRWTGGSPQSMIGWFDSCGPVRSLSPQPPRRRIMRHPRPSGQTSQVTSPVNHSR